MISSPPQSSRARGVAPALLVTLAGAAAAAAWLWICWCLFPARGWNDVRLAPVFGLKLGLALYPGTTGPASTWMYGPLPLLLLWPATWAVNAGQALLIAGGLNLAILLAAIAAVCAWWPGRGSEPIPWSARGAAALLAVAIWPGAAWQYLQADNSAIVFGLLANLLLVRARSPSLRWAAAFLAMAGLFCKQTAAGVPAAQLLWLAVTQDRTAVRDQLLRLLAAGAAMAVLFLATNDLRGAWFNLIATPAALPWTEKPWQRVWDLAPFLAVHLSLPVLAWAGLRRGPWRQGLALPTLTWLVAWLPGIAAMLKIGGSLNNLHAFPLWLPPGMVVLCACAAERLGTRRMQAATGLAVLILCSWRLALLPSPPLHPKLELYQQASALARDFPEKIWFPWHPLVTVFSDHRLYHVEDGLYVRFVSGHPLTYAEAVRHLPAQMSVIALPRNASDWGIALRLAPPNARTTDAGLWTLRSWSAPPAASP